VALRRAQTRHEAGDLTLHRPAHEEREAARVTASGLADELTAQANDLAERFDQRNGTDRVGRMVRETLAGEPWIEHLPLSPTASTRARSAASYGSTVEELFAKSVPSPPAPPPPQSPAPVLVPETNGPDELLDLIEEYQDADDDARADSALDDFEARYGGQALSARQRARLADARAARLVIGEDRDEAVQMWRAAATDYAAAGDPEGEHTARARAALALCWRGDRDDELPALVEATEWLLAHGSAKARVAAATRLATVHHNAQRAGEALATLDRAAGSLGEAPLRQRARHAVIRLIALAQLRRADEILQTGPDAIALAEAAGDDDETARAHSTLAAAHQYTGAFDEAAAHLRAAMDLSTDEQMRARLRSRRAYLLARTDRAIDAVDDLVEQVADATARGLHGEAADARHSLAIAYLNSDRLLDAAEVAEEELAYRLRDDQAAPDDRMAIRNLLATIYQRLGQPVEAVEQLDAMADECAKAGDRAGVGQAAQRAGEILDGADRDEEAAARFLVAADICAEIDQPLPELYNRRRHAISLRWASRTGEAVEALAAADAAAPRMPVDGEQARWELARLDYDAARILWAAGQLADAAQRAGRAAEASLALNSQGSAAESWLMQARILLDAAVSPEGGRDAARAAEAEAAIQLALAVLPDGADRQPYEEVLETARRAPGRTDSPEETP
jgi:tetratricopeptide (TPR) repeat protein